jgi:hypothetical protein
MCAGMKLFGKHRKLFVLPSINKVGEVSSATMIGGVVHVKKSTNHLAYSPATARLCQGDLTSTHSIMPGFLLIS